jgi:hypothetical protein
MAISVLPLLLTHRWGELTESLRKLHIADQPVELAAFGFHFASGCAVTGAALTVAAMIAASVYKLESSSKAPCPYLRILAGCGWCVLAALELFLSVICTSGPWSAQLAALGIALATLLFETMAAILVLEYTIPEALATLSSIFDTFNR